METLEIEDLKILLCLIDNELDKNWRAIPVNSLEKSRAIIEQMINDIEFEQSQTTLNKL